jgi:hypothetical protein
MTIDTKVNCNNCISKIQHELNQLLGEGKWSVNINLPNKPLTFPDDAVVEEVLDLLEEFNMSA